MDYDPRPLSERLAEAREKMAVDQFNKGNFTDQIGKFNDDEKAFLNNIFSEESERRKIEIEREKEERKSFRRALVEQVVKAPSHETKPVITIKKVAVKSKDVQTAVLETILVRKRKSTSAPTNAKNESQVKKSKIISPSLASDKTSKLPITLSKSVVPLVAYYGSDSDE